MTKHTIDPDFCKQIVYDRFLRIDVSGHQCIYKPWKDGFCKIHHPETVKAKDEARSKAWRERWDREAREREEKKRKQAHADACVAALHGLNPSAVREVVNSFSDLLAIAKIYLEECGPCDHSVNCGIAETINAAEAALSRLEENL